LPISPQYAIVRTTLAGQEGRMDILAVIGAITGVLGLGLAILLAFRQARNDRMTFLADRIFDISIPRELRLPFYEEYISKKGNGTAVKFWLMEASK
jgi:ribosomal protein S5